MDFRKFRTLFAGRDFFTREEVQLRAPDLRTQNLSDWSKLGWVRKITRGVWDFSKRYGNEKYAWAASLLVRSHSYVSLEAALRHHNLIPEEVFMTTCVTTQKPESFSTPFERFRFQKIPARAFIGYTVGKIGNHTYQIATAEKAIVDFLWLHPDIRTLDDHEEMRWSMFSILELKIEDIRGYAVLFGKKPFLARVEVFIDFVVREIDKQNLSLALSFPPKGRDKLRRGNRSH